MLCGRTLNARVRVRVHLTVFLERLVVGRRVEPEADAGARAARAALPLFGARARNPSLLQRAHPSLLVMRHLLHL